MRQFQLKKNLRQPKHLFVWGDSHAQQLNYGLVHNLPANWQILQVASSGCDASLGPFPNANTISCERSNSIAIETISKKPPNIVIIAQRYRHNAENAATIAKWLREIGVEQVLFIGPVPQWEAELPKIIARHLWIATPERTFVGLNPGMPEGNAALRRDYENSGLSYVDAFAVFCNSEGCLIRVGPDRMHDITTIDYGHLLPKASSYFVQRGVMPYIR